MSSNGVTYTSVDLNATGTTTVFDPSHNESTVEQVALENTGSTAVVQLEVTDGTNTVVLTPGQAAGDGVSYTGPLPLDGPQTLRVNVTTAEGAALSGTAGAFTR